MQGEVVRALTAAGGEIPAMMIPVLSGTKTNTCHAVATRHRMQAETGIARMALEGL